jgi:hypothetical protein
MDGIEMAWAERKAMPPQELAQRLDNEGGVVAAAFSRSMREAASWSLAAEMVRRHPGRLCIVTSVPIEGVPYDCLRICRPDIDRCADLNRFTTGSASGWTSQEHDAWVADRLLSVWMSTDDRRSLAASVEAWLELPGTRRVPAAPRRDLTYRAIAAFLTSRIFDQERWGVRGLCDAGGLCVDADVASLFGLRTHIPGWWSVAEVMALPEANLFAVCREGVPVASITTDAVLTPLGAAPIDLARARRGPDGITSVVATMARALA